MTRRCGLLLLTALCAWSSGCAGTARREDGSPIFGPRAWNEPPAPPQRSLGVMTARTTPSADPADRSEGLAKYFPNLRRGQAELSRVAAKARPTWFGPKTTGGAGTQTYMTDAREQLNRTRSGPGPEPTVLPVALQVPTDRNASDRQVTPTNAETTTFDDKPLPPTWEPDRPKLANKGDEPLPSASANVPDFGGKPSRPGEDEVNPLPPATEPDSSRSSLADKMPQVPAVEPGDRAKGERPGDEPGSDDQAMKANARADEPAAKKEEPAKPTQPTTQAVASSNLTPTSAKVMATPQGNPPKPVAHLAHAAKPSPQAEATPPKKHWKRPCLRRLVRKLCNLGEYADPPTAAPH